MKFISFYTYFFSSLIAFIYVITKAWKSFGNFFDMCIELISNDKYYLILQNMLVLLIHILIYSAISISIGRPTSSDQTRAIDTLFSSIFQLLYQATSLNTPVSDNEFMKIPSLLYLRYVTILLRQKILEIPIRIKPPTLAQHHRLFCLQFLLFFVTFYVCILP